MKTRILFLLLLVILGCKRQVDNVQPMEEFACFDSERFGLNSIANEANTKHIRIWYSHSFLDRVPVVSLKQSKMGEWSGELFLIILNIDKHPPTVKETRSKKLNPRTSWDTLHKKLADFQIYSLPDMQNIQGLEDRWLDGSSYTVEIAIDDSCWYYSYHLPDKFKNEFWQAENMVLILDELKKELSIPWAINDSTGVREFWTMANDTTLKTVQ